MFLESLQPFNTAGKLKNFPHEAAAVKAQKASLDLTREVEELVQMVQQVAPLTSYLGKAEALLDAGHAWQEEVRTSRASLLTKIGSPKHPRGSEFPAPPRPDPGGAEGQVPGRLSRAHTNELGSARTTTRGRLQSRRIRDLDSSRSSLASR